MRGSGRFRDFGSTGAPGSINRTHNTHLTGQGEKMGSVSPVIKIPIYCYTYNIRLDHTAAERFARNLTRKYRRRIGGPGEWCNYCREIISHTAALLPRGGSAVYSSSAILFIKREFRSVLIIICPAAVKVSRPRKVHPRPPSRVYNGRP